MILPESRNITWFVPVKTKNPLNTREHYRVVAKRATQEKWLTKLRAPKRPADLKLPCVVVLTRLSQRTMDSHDGLRAATKHVADGVAEWVGVDDREGDGLTFKYEQEKCKKGEFGVHVRVIEDARVVELLVVASDKGAA